MGLLLCATALSWLGRWQAGLLLCAGWARKRFRREKKETKTQDRSPGRLPPWHARERAGEGRGRPRRAPGGRPAAGTGPGRCTTARGGVREPGNHGVRRHGRRRRRPRRELGWSLGAAMRWARGYGEAGNGPGGHREAGQRWGRTRGGAPRPGEGLGSRGIAGSPTRSTTTTATAGARVELGGGDEVGR